MKKLSFDAVIFDLDGVITKTAVVHAKAWKAVFDEYLRLREKRNGEKFREFRHDQDYLPYVDGKPRYQGVQSFLQSRGISLPYGRLDDTPDKETVCGLGNKKNVLFRKFLQKEGVQTYLPAIQFVKAIKKRGVRVGVASSSRNCLLMLRAAKINKLFATRVDGVVSAKIGLVGKPEGDIFVRAARNLGAFAKKAVVVEDAVSGVQAGRNGQFGLVIGVARKENQSELLENNADIAVDDLSLISLDWMEKWFQRKPRPLFKSWNKAVKKPKSKILFNPYYFASGKGAILNKKRLVLFLDYDGTLTPIVQRPELAVLSEEMRETLKRLSQQHTVAIVSGRMREDVQKLVNIKGLFYVGSHGFDISGPGVSVVQPKAEKFIPLISKIRDQLWTKLKDINGILIEEKKFSVAVHYRLVAKKYLSRIRKEVEDIIRKNKELCLMQGKKVFEILPDIQWDKGKAIRWIIQALNISWPEASVVYIGDDSTDEDAFRIVRTRGHGILVADKPRKSAADFQLFSTEEVKRLFEKVIASSAKD